jgi:FkbM family methyltransferase
VTVLRTLARHAAASVSGVDVLYRFCRRVVDHHRGDNDDDMRVNGEVALMRQRLPSASVVFDVGANVGDWTACALAINARAEYHCFEPSAATFAALQQRGWPPNVRLNHGALGAANGPMTLHVFGERLGANSLYDRRGTDARTQRLEAVAVGTVDGYCADHGIGRIDFLKLDTEGHELAVLEGASSMLRDGRIEAIQFEYGGTYIDARIWLRDVWDLVGRLNPVYRFYKLHPDGPRRIDAYRQTLETFQYSNWAILKDGA